MCGLEVEWCRMLGAPHIMMYLENIIDCKPDQHVLNHYPCSVLSDLVTPALSFCPPSIPSHTPLVSFVKEKYFPLTINTTAI